MQRLRNWRSKTKSPYDQGFVVYYKGMLKKNERLTRKEFDHFFSVGKRLHSPLAQLIYAESNAFHASAVVGKKVAKKAVHRNTLRRRLYALLYAQRTYTPPRTYILIAKPPLAQLSRTEAREAVLSLLKQVPHA